jgi:voltage-gated potassium channel
MGGHYPWRSERRANPAHCPAFPAPGILRLMRARLHTPPHPAPLSSLLSRILLLLTVLLSTVSLLYVEGGLRDDETGQAPGVLGTLYFTMVTITTVGYGDIVPVSTFARMTDTFFLTPMRFIVLVLFVGIAYELTFKRLQENVRMNRVVQKLKDHIIVCGYGENGQVSVDQLIASGFARNQMASHAIRSWSWIRTRRRWTKPPSARS